MLAPKQKPFLYSILPVSAAAVTSLLKNEFWSLLAGAAGCGWCSRRTPPHTSSDFIALLEKLKRLKAFSQLPHNISRIILVCNHKPAAATQTMKDKTQT